MSKPKHLEYGIADKAWHFAIGCREDRNCGKNCWARKTDARIVECQRGVPDAIRKNDRAEFFASVLTPDLKHWNGKVRIDEKHLADPLRRRKPTLYASGFHCDPALLTPEDLDRVFAVAALCPQHRILMLTKRPARTLEYCSITQGNIRVMGAALGTDGLPDYPGRYRVMQDGYRNKQVDVDVYDAKAKGLACFADDIGSGGTGVNDATDCHVSVQNTGLEFIGLAAPWPLPNVHLGVSITNQSDLTEHLPAMRALHELGWKLHVWHEPAIGPVDWARCSFLECIIAGGESGANARPAHPDWFRRTRDWCAAVGVAFVFKQWGEHIPGRLYRDGERIVPDTRACGLIGAPLRASDPTVLAVGSGYAIRVGKKAAGCLLDGREHKQLPSDLRLPPTR